MFVSSSLALDHVCDARISFGPWSAPWKLCKVCCGRSPRASVIFFTLYFESVASCGSSGRAGSTLMESMWVWTQPLLTFLGSPSRTSAERMSSHLISLSISSSCRQAHRDHHRTSSHVVVLALSSSSSCRQVHGSHGIITALPLMSSFLLSHYRIPAARCTGVTGSSPHFLSCRRSCSLIILFLPPGARESRDHHRTSSHVVVLSLSPSSSCRQMHASQGIITALPLMSSFLLSHYPLPAARRTGVTGP